MPGAANVDALIEMHSAERPAAICLRHGDQQFSWSDLADRRLAYADYLLAQEVGRGDRVVIQEGLSPELLFLLLGLWRLGAVAVMSNTANTVREVAELVALSQPSLAVIEDDQLRCDLERELAGRVINLKRLALPEARGLDDGRSSLVELDDEATLIFTSGSTAAPKCVPLRHGHHLHTGTVVQAMLGLTERDSFLEFFPLFHMNGLGHVLGTLTAGGTLVMKSRYRTGSFRAWVSDDRPTVTALNATHIKMLASVSERLAPGDSSLRRVQLGLSAVLPEHLYDEFESEFGCTLIESYGLTESVTLCSGGPLAGSKRRSCGRALDGYEIRIVDDDDQPVPDPVRGRVQICADSRFGLMTGYLGEEPLRPGEWLDTGDVGHLDADGFFFWEEREKELIKRAGENIAPTEVEQVIESHPAVAEAAVVGVADDLREEVPWAWVRLCEGETAVEAELLEHCRRALARFKVPEGIDFVADFPRTGVGKIQRAAVRQWHPERRS